MIVAGWVADYIDEELDARNWDHADLARIIGRSLEDVSALLSGGVTLTPDMAQRLGHVFGTGTAYWLDLADAAYRRSSGCCLPCWTGDHFQCRDEGCVCCGGCK